MSAKIKKVVKLIDKIGFWFSVSMLFIIPILARYDHQRGYDVPYPQLIQSWVIFALATLIFIEREF